MLRVYLVLLVFMTGAAFAQEQQFLSSNGILFDYEQNQHGVALTATEQADGLLINADETQSVKKLGEAVYLGRGCDAFSLKLGNGSWQSTEGGFLVQFRNVQIAFPGQQIDVGRGVTCTE